MTQGFNDHIRRRQDGSIDTEFYVQRAIGLRHAAMQEDPRRWAMYLRKWLRSWRATPAAEIHLSRNLESRRCRAEIPRRNG